MSDNVSGVRVNWLAMSANAFATAGTQLDMLGGLVGDGYGTLDLLDAAAEVAPALEAAPAADGGLFAVTLEMVAPVEGGLF